MDKVESASDDSDSISEELNEQQLMNMNKHLRNRKYGRNTRMNQEMDSLYKSALMNVIFGKFQQASQKLKHLITFYPDNPQPYQLMGTMHEQTGDLRKAVEYFFINTYLSPPNFQKWVKVADMSMDLQMYDQAAYCYGRALKIQNYNVQLSLKRAQAFEHTGNDKKAIIMYKRILKFTKSLTAIKKYARLRYRRKQFEKARQILYTIPQYQKDQNILFMILQTIMKEKKYQELFEIMTKTVLIPNNYNLENISVQFVRMAYVCLVQGSFNINLDKQIIQKQFYQCYQQPDAQQYQQILQIFIDKNPQQALKLVLFLLKFEKHQSVNNYILASEHLKIFKKYQQAEQIIQEGLKLNEGSAQLQTQLIHIRVMSGKKQTITVQKKKPMPSLKKYANHDDDVFYSDSQSLDLQISKEKIQFPIQKKSSSKAKKHTENQNEQMLIKLLKNTNMTIQMILQKIDEDQSKQNVLKNYKDFYQTVELLTEIFQQNNELNINNQQIIPNSLITQSSKHKDRLTLRHTKCVKLLNQHIDHINQTLSLIRQYIVHLLKLQQHRKIINVVEKLTKATFFKRQLRNQNFNKNKLDIYQISILACLKLKKINRALFYGRYLVSKHPNNKFYILMIKYLAHNSSKRNCLGPMFRKFLVNQAKQGQQLFHLLLGLEHINTGEFQICINILTSILSKLDKNYLPMIYLYLSGCFLQLASSRNTYNKLDCTNRSAFCLKQYINNSIDINSLQVKFNTGRWFSQVKINERAIYYFQQILTSEQASKQLKQKSAYNLMCIYKDINAWQKLNQLSSKYFSVTN